VVELVGGTVEFDGGTLDVVAGTVVVVRGTVVVVGGTVVVGAELEELTPRPPGPDGVEAGTLVVEDVGPSGDAPGRRLASPRPMMAKR